MGFLGIGSDKERTTTTEQALDPRSQQFLDESRRQAGGASDFALNAPGNFFLGSDPRSVSDIIQPFMDPFQQNVIDASAAEFDVLRERAVGGAGGTNQRAQLAGGFGGSRQGVAEGLRLSELDRAQTTQTAGLLSRNFQQAVQSGIPFAQQQRALDQQQAQEGLFRRQQAQGFRNAGLGPVGTDTTQTQIQKGSVFGDLAGIGLAGAGLFTNPGGTIASAVGNQFAGGQQDFGLPSGLGELNFPAVGR